MAEIVFLTGLPRSGSTLLANILSQHPDIISTPSSPLNSIIHGMKNIWSNDPFLLSQLDDNFEDTYKTLENSTRAFMDTWSEKGKKITIDKNRGWLTNAEFLRALYPQFKMIVCIRDLRGVFASVEKKHKKTILLNFPDATNPDDVNARADALFSNNGVIGSCIKSIDNIKDIPNLLEHLFFVRFEDLTTKPKEVMDALFKWLGVKPAQIDFTKIKQVTQESDSYHRMKYSHKISEKVQPPLTLETTPISPRILQTIITKYDWFYKDYYPEYFKEASAQQVQEQTTTIETNKELEERIAKEIEEELKAVDSKKENKTTQKSKKETVKRD